MAFGLVALTPTAVRAASAANAYVTVSCSTPGVESVVVDGKDFFLATRGVGKPSFRAAVSVSARPPWVLTSPAAGQMDLGIGDVGSYLVRDDTGLEDSFDGNVEVLKVDVEQVETNVCWRTTSCSLNLTDDSNPGGDAVWTSSPAGISGRGRAIAFSPSALDPGEYTVTARSEKAPSCFDSCVVRVVRVDITMPQDDTVSLLGGEVLFVAEVVPKEFGTNAKFSWSVCEGSCDPQMSEEDRFCVELKSEGRVGVRLSARWDGLTCETERTIVSIRPEVIELGWQDDHKLVRWGGDAIEDPVWIMSLDGTVSKNEPGVYTRKTNAKASLVVSALRDLSSAKEVMVKGLGNGVSFMPCPTSFFQWDEDGDGLVLVSSQLPDGVDYYDTLDVEWMYCVRKSDSSWGGWVLMNRTSHVLYIVDSTPSAQPLYDFGVDKACRYADGSLDFARAINVGLASEIIYDPTAETSHDLGIYDIGRGQCCFHAFVFSLLISHVSSHSQTPVYCWGGCGMSVWCLFKMRSGESVWQPSFQCQRPSTDGVPANPHFTFHVEVPVGDAVYDPAYGVTGWAPLLEVAPATTNGHLRPASFQSGVSLPRTEHEVDWFCGHH